MNSREEQMTVLTSRFTDAFSYAAEAHARQERKGGHIPYVSHLMAVASHVLENGGDEDAAIAALLHDAPEDQGGEPRLAEIRKRFGDRVAGIVRECSDSLTEDPKAKAPWRDRKRAYLEHLRASSDQAYLLVSCADKLHNAQAILRDFRADGHEVWVRFTADEKKTDVEIVGFYDALAETFANRLPGPMANELQSTVKSLVAESGLTPDRGWEHRS
jgi:(p)ppGpp synthase/HD superfamily hydrolase